MGAWGIKLYQNDVALDVKNDYLDWLKIGKTNQEATQQVIDNYINYINDIDDGPVFWFALAETQWKYGRLLPEVKEKALEYIENGIDLIKWQDDDKLYKKRKEELNKLHEKLNSPQPPEKKVSKLYLHKANWQVGDVLLYQIKNEQFKESEWYQKYILLRVVGIAKSNIGSLPREYSHEHDIVSVYNWIGDNIPDLNMINNLNFLEQKNIFGKTEDMMLIFSYNRNELKHLNIKILTGDCEYKYVSDKATSLVGKTWYNIKNLDRGLIVCLNNAKEKNELIIDIKTN